MVTNAIGFVILSSCFNQYCNIIYRSIGVYSDEVSGIGNFVVWSKQDFAKTRPNLVTKGSALGATKEMKPQMAK